ncbi:MAG TPA: NAD(P)/FAD-dependent oxidoreductase [Solirubrobacteraceae bacterium]|nr:NAD(P)/FAD-dependent oxidoreductase [Solirubrobacteraceae bacterium]
MTRALVCGAGPAGLATAACLKQAGVEVTVLERGEAVGAAWRRRYGALRLNTLGSMSGLPGYRATRRRYGEFPTRDMWVRYLEDYTRHHQLDISCGVEVQRIERAPGGWLLHTSAGEREASFVVMATGFDHDPHIPRWTGLESFQSEIIHAGEYQDPEPYRGRDVLIVGGASSGSEIAAFLANGGAGRVRVAMRTPPTLSKRRWLGGPTNPSAVLLDHLPDKLADTIIRTSQRMMFGDLSTYGLPHPPLGLKSSIKHRLIGAAIDDGFVAALKEGRIEITPPLDSLDGREVILADGSRLQPEVVICATGYRRGLAELVGHLDVLDARELPRGYPTVEVRGVPGLFFVGYFSKVSGQLRQMRFEARRVARSVCRQPQPAPPEHEPVSASVRVS